MKDQFNRWAESCGIQLKNKHAREAAYKVWLIMANVLSDKHGELERALDENERLKQSNEDLAEVAREVQEAIQAETKLLKRED